jgi:hypothetical protein
MFASLFTSLLVLASMPLVSANCTTWTDAHSLSDISSSFSNEFEQTIATLVCPLSDNVTCTFGRQTYQITISRNLNISASPADVDNIFDLAQQYYGAGTNFTTGPFVTRTTNISTTDSRTVDQSLLEVAPGKNKSLLWVPYMKYSFGNLGGCSNTSLNGVGVRAAASYLTTDMNNNTVVAGGWGAITSNATTNDGKSTAGSLRGGGMTGVFVGMAAVIFASVL